MMHAQASLRMVRANGAEFHYLQRGTGAPVIFVHGGLLDYRRWAAHIEPFSQQYNVIAYSRRYNYPNSNIVSADYSAVVDADDLAAIIRELKLGPCHIVGESYGAYGGLLLALRHPDVVRTLVLAEAPLFCWLDRSIEGKRIRNEFLDNFWKPVGASLRRGNRLQALQTIVGHFLPGANVSDLPAELRSVIEANLDEWEVLTASRDAFPDVNRESVSALQVPVVLLSGEQTLDEHKIIDAELEHLLPNGSRVIVAGTTHEMWDEQPEACRDCTLQFVADHHGAP